jgi:glutaredoxin
MVNVETPASAYEMEQAAAATHIKPNERSRLMQQMCGHIAYEPRLGGQGQVLRCKYGGCSNAALGDARKQLCPTHYASFLEKSNAAQKIPFCASCGLNRTRQLYFNTPMCPSCHATLAAVQDAELRLERSAREKQVAHDLKLRELDNAETVHELREWIKEYML